MKMVFVIICSLFMLSSQAGEKEALSTIKKLGENLQKELKSGMKRGALNALQVCNTKAGKITKDAAANGIFVGRVSKKNRNPNNNPRAWMLEYIEKFHKNEIKKPYIVTNIGMGKKGLLKPIPTMPLCLNCHGEKINPELQKKITELYPDDKATGYKVGQIRGFFWAEFR